MELDYKRVIDEVKTCENENDWDKTVQNREIRKIIFHAYASNFLNAKDKIRKCHNNLFNTDLTNPEKYCQGCWMCCTRHPEIKYDDFIKRHKKNVKNKNKANEKKKIADIIAQAHHYMVEGNVTKMLKCYDDIIEAGCAEFAIDIIHYYD